MKQYNGRITKKEAIKKYLVDTGWGQSLSSAIARDLGFDLCETHNILTSLYKSGYLEKERVGKSVCYYIKNKV